MRDLSLLEIPRIFFGTIVRLGISEEIGRKRKIRIRREIMILMMSLKNVIRRMVDMPLL
jgi:hypothetical protein